MIGALPSYQGELGLRSISAPKLDAASAHRWMGRRLDAIEDAELRLILIDLERFAYGAGRHHVSLGRTGLIQAIYRLDRDLDAVRGAT